MLIYETLKLSKTEDLPKITVIIPVYNAEEYVGLCIESVLNQTINNIEIIVTDDCSADNSLEIARLIAEKHNNISVYKTSKPSGSPAMGRNIGLENAKGEYVLFVDSDDWIDSNYIEELYQSIIKHDGDICFSSGFKNHYNGEVTTRYYKENHLDSSNELKGFHESFMLWDKMFKKNFILENKLLISDMIASEELLFIVKAYYLSNKSTVSVGNYGYNYRRLNDNSITKSKRMVLYPNYEFHSWNLVDNWINNNDIPHAYRQIVNLRKVLSFSYALSIINPIFEKRFLEEIKKYIPLTTKDEIQEIAKKLNYEKNILDFFKKYDLDVFSNVSEKKSMIYGPDWSKSNEYQSLLSESLKSEYNLYSTGFSPKQFNIEYLKEKRKSCDVLHLHWLHAFYNVSEVSSVEGFIKAVKYAKSIGYTILVTIHNIFPHESGYNEELVHKRVQQEVYDISDCILVHSKPVKNQVIDLFNINSTKVYVTPHGLYPIKYELNAKNRNMAKEKIGYDDNDFVASIVGRIRQYKGIDLALSEFQNFQKKNTLSAKLIIAGFPDDKKIDESIKKATKYNSSIKYIDREITDIELAEILLASDVCLLPYEKGTTSGVAYLSLSYRTPMITSNIECFDEFSEKGFSLKVDHKNINTALEYLCNAYFSNSLNTIFGNLNEKDSINSYRWDYIVKSEPYKTIFS